MPAIHKSSCGRKAGPDPRQILARVAAPVINQLASADMAWEKNIEKPDTIAMNVIAKLAIFDQNSFCD
jgi:hypothetical protein